MKRRIRIILIILFLLIFFLASGYFLLASYYSKKFSLCTWINGVYCTGKTVEEANAELLSRIEAPIVIITDEDGNNYELNFGELGFEMDYTSELIRLQQEQNPLLWIRNIKCHGENTIDPVIGYNMSMLKAAFEEVPFVKKALSVSKLCYLQRYEGTGYQLVDNLQHRLDAEASFHRLVELMDEGMKVIAAEDFAVYYDEQPTKEQERYRELWTILEAYYNCDIVYDMGAEQIALTSDILTDFLVTEEGLPIQDASGALVLNEEKVVEFVQSLGEAYDTYKKDRSFQSTRGDTITITKGNYGTKLKLDEEIDFLMHNLMSDSMHTGKVQLHQPVYEKEAFVRGRDDIGGTYIEIDMTEQKLYFYVDGELTVETDIVTGNMKRKMGTPEGIYYIYSKQTDRILRGTGYATHVDYWMPINGNIGIHDADWRNKFGGTIYKTNGSHGCINIPPEVMPKLYENAEIGTPVILFY